jgi:hypothetical protein
MSGCSRRQMSPVALVRLLIRFGRCGSGSALRPWCRGGRVGERVGGCGRPGSVGDGGCRIALAEPELLTAAIGVADLVVDDPSPVALPHWGSGREARPRCTTSAACRLVRPPDRRIPARPPGAGWAPHGWLPGRPSARARRRRGPGTAGGARSGCRRALGYRRRGVPEVARPRWRGATAVGAGSARHQNAVEPVDDPATTRPGPAVLGELRAGIAVARWPAGHRNLPVLLIRAASEEDFRSHGANAPQLRTRSPT